LLHNLTPHKLNILFSLSCALAPGFFLVIPSFCGIVCPPQYLSICLLQSFCTVLGLVLYCLVYESLLVLPSPNNPLKVALGVQSRGHSVEQFIFSCCHANTFLVAARTKFYLAGDWQGMSILPLGNIFMESCSAADLSSWPSRKRLNNSLPRN
jgi:hypothetical protein